MSDYIKKYFSELNITITPKMISNFLDIVVTWENRRDTPLVLHGQLIGVYDIKFLQSDREQLFHLVGVDSKTISDIVKRIPTINSNFNVISDPFNLLTVWMIHLAEIQIKNNKLKELFKLALLKYLHYKFLTALTQKSFPHKVDEGVMIATVMDLSRKFDIIKYGSWYNAIEARCKDALDDGSIHKRTLITAEPDDKFIYFIVDTFNRMSAKIKLIATEFYKKHSAGVAVGSSSATMTDAEGEKMVIEKSSTIQMVDSRLSRDILNVNSWVNLTAVNNVGSQFPAISRNLIKVALTEMSALATAQSKVKDFYPYETVDGERVIVGISHLVKLIVTTSAAIVANEGISLTNTLAAWKTLRNAFSSSRILDPDVLLIRASTANFVNNLGAVSREATKISLRMSIVMYVVYKFILLVK